MSAATGRLTRYNVAWAAPNAHHTRAVCAAYATATRAAPATMVRMAGSAALSMDQPAMAAAAWNGTRWLMRRAMMVSAPSGRTAPRSDGSVVNSAATVDASAAARAASSVDA